MKERLSRLVQSIPVKFSESQTNRPSGIQWLLIWAVLLASYPFFPLLAWMGGVTLFASVGWKRAGALWAYLAFLPLSTISNLSVTNPGDWGWYQAQYYEYFGLAFLDNLGNSNFPANQAEEPAYYFFSWLLAQLSIADISALSLAINAVVYGSLGLSAILIGKRLELSSYSLAGLQFFLYSVSVNFVLVHHLVRQTIAISFLILALALFLDSQVIPGVLVVALAALTHTPSAVLGLFLFASFSAIALKNPRLYWGFLPLGFLVGLVAWVTYGKDYNGRSDGDVALPLVVFHLLVFVAVQSFDWASHSGWERFKGVLSGWILLSAGFISGQMGEPIPILRFYLYLEPVLFLMTWALLQRYVLPRARGVVPLVLLIVSELAAVAIIQLRIQLSEFGYSITLFDFLSWVTFG